MTPPSTLRHRGEVRCRRAHRPHGDRDPVPTRDVGSTRRNHGATDDRCGPAGTLEPRTPGPWPVGAGQHEQRAAECTRPHRAASWVSGPAYRTTTSSPPVARPFSHLSIRNSWVRCCRSRCDEARRTPTGDLSPQLVAWGQPTARRPGRASRRFCSLWNSTTVSPRSFGCRVGNSRKRPASVPRSYQRSISASVSPRLTRRSRPVGSTVTAPPVLSRRQAVGVPILGVGGPWTQGRRWDDSARRPYEWMDHMAELP